MKSLKDHIIDSENLADHVANLGLSPQETELVLLKLSILLQDHLLEWILEKLSVEDQQRMADILMSQESSDGALEWFEKHIPDFKTQASAATRVYQEQLLEQIRQALEQRKS